MKNGKIYELESLRGIFAFLIVIFHFPTDNFFYNNNFIKNSFFVVDFFFVLSGFIISFNYEKKIIDLNSLKIFLKKRFFRLYPLHLVFLILFVFIELLKIYAAKNYQIFPNSGFNSIADFFKNLFLIHGINDTSFNEPSWSISVEFVTYIIFALYCVFFKNKNFFPIIFIIVGALLIIYDIEKNSFSQLGRCMYSFFLGFYTYKIINKSLNINSKYFSFIVFFIILFSISLDIKFKFLLLPIFFSIMIFIIISDIHNSLLKKMLNLNILKFLGKISYSLYIAHFMIAYLFRQLLHFVFGFEYLNKLLVLENYFLPIILVYFFVVIFLSKLTYNFIENRYRIK